MYNKHIQFEFDAAKEAANVIKHGIDFKTASEVFFDDHAIVAQDLKHSQYEQRWLVIGRIGDGRIITVWYSEREGKVRIIGAAELRRWRKEYEKRKIAGSEQTEMD
jgi:uncharacterized protein